MKYFRTAFLPCQRSLDWFIKTISLQVKTDLDNPFLHIVRQYTRDEIIRLTVTSCLSWAKASYSQGTPVDPTPAGANGQIPYQPLPKGHGYGLNAKTQPHKAAVKLVGANGLGPSTSRM